ncbi:MAG TPA: zinc-dependent peptidase [Armatimonadota bacterium]|nr:zinc-dependent peptidase [Armatimonadota bacterium]
MGQSWWSIGTNWAAKHIGRPVEQAANEGVQYAKKEAHYINKYAIQPAVKNVEQKVHNFYEPVRMAGLQTNNYVVQPAVDTGKKLIAKGKQVVGLDDHPVQRRQPAQKVVYGPPSPPRRAVIDGKREQNETRGKRFLRIIGDAQHILSAQMAGKATDADRARLREIQAALTSDYDLSPSEIQYNLTGVRTKPSFTEQVNQNASDAQNGYLKGATDHEQQNEARYRFNAYSEALRSGDMQKASNMYEVIRRIDGYTPPTPPTLHSYLATNRLPKSVMHQADTQRHYQEGAQYLEDHDNYTTSDIQQKIDAARQQNAGPEVIEPLLAAQAIRKAQEDTEKLSVNKSFAANTIPLKFFFAGPRREDEVAGDLRQQAMRSGNPYQSQADLNIADSLEQAGIANHHSPDRNSIVPVYLQNVYNNHIGFGNGLYNTAASVANALSEGGTNVVNTLTGQQYGAPQLAYRQGGSNYGQNLGGSLGTLAEMYILHRGGQLAAESQMPNLPIQTAGQQILSNTAGALVANAALQTQDAVARGEGIGGGIDRVAASSLPVTLGTLASGGLGHLMNYLPKGIPTRVGQVVVPGAADAAGWAGGQYYADNGQKPYREELKDMAGFGAMLGVLHLPHQARQGFVEGRVAKAIKMFRESGMSDEEIRTVLQDRFQQPEQIEPVRETADQPFTPTHVWTKGKIETPVVLHSDLGNGSYQVRDAQGNVHTVNSKRVRPVENTEAAPEPVMNTQPPTVPTEQEPEIPTPIESTAPEEQQSVETASRPEMYQPGWIGQMNPQQIKADPQRFQYKIGMGENGTGGELRGVQQYDPELGGILSVWKDPANGQTYVVNGHHRLELAKRTGADAVTVRFLDADTAEDARTKGALINIAEGRGSAIDAAKLFRDTHLTADDLQNVGISLKGKMAREGIALANLHPALFGRVAREEMPLSRGVIIGEQLPNQGKQLDLVKMIDKTEKSGRRVNDGTLSELIRFVNGSEQHTTTTNSLFGEEEITQTNALEKAELSSFVKDRLSKDARLFGYVSKGNRAQELERGGNSINVEESGKIAKEANQALATFEQLSVTKGPIADALNEAANEYKGASRSQQNSIRENLYERVKQAVSDTLTGKETEIPQRIQADDRRGVIDTGRRDTETADLFGNAEPTLPTDTKPTVRNDEPAGAHPLTLADFKEQSVQAGFEPRIVDAAAKVIEAFAKRHGMTADDYISRNIAEVRKGTLEDVGGDEGTFQANHGATAIMPDGRAVILSLTKPNASTLIHEIGHIFHETLSPELKTQVNKFFGIKDGGEWNMVQAERFARLFERYMRDGKAPTKKLEAVFAQFREWLTKVYRTLKNSPIAEAVPNEMRDVFTDMLGGDVKAIGKQTTKRPHGTTPVELKYGVIKDGNAYVAPDGERFTGRQAKETAEFYAFQKSLEGKTVKTYFGNSDQVLKIEFPNGPVERRVIYTVKNMETGEIRQHGTLITPKDVIETSGKKLSTGKAASLSIEKSGYGESNTLFTKENYNAALERLRSRGKHLNAGVDPTIIKDLAILAGHHIEASMRASKTEFDKWSQTTIQMLGLWVKPHLQEAWKLASNRLDIGEFGPRYRQFSGKPEDAVKHLLLVKNGEVPKALYHPEVGDIDLIWGNKGSKKGNGYGLAKIADKHPEVIDDLQNIINKMHVRERTENSIILESSTHDAVVKLDWKGFPKKWLLTAFEKEDSLAAKSTIDVSSEPNNGQTRRQTTLSTSEQQNNITTSTAEVKVPSSPKKGTVLQSTVLPGAKEFIEQDVVPSVTEAARTVVETADELHQLLSPSSRGEQAAMTARVIRAHTGGLARKTEQAYHALESFARAFDRMKESDRLDFINRMETGKVQATPELARVARILREVLDERRDAIIALGTGKLEHFIKGYFPHIYEDPKKSGSTIQRIFGKRPLEGSKSFLKHRSIPTLQDGIAMGLKPVTTNPVELVLLKLREMDKYITGQKIIADLNQNGLLPFVRSGEVPPDNYAHIDDAFATVYGPPEIKVKEAFDEQLMHKLTAFAKSLGINVERKVNVGGRNRWGYAEGADKNVERFAGPESVLMHELGHNIDAKFNAWDFFTQKGNVRVPGVQKARIQINQELRKLADLRYEGHEDTVPDRYKSYVRSKGEKMAVVLEAFLHAPERMQQVAPTVYKRLQQFINIHPELKPLLDIKPALVMGTNEAAIPVPGLRIMGKYMAPEPVARVLNNHLSPGLAKYPAFEAFRKAGNLLNQAQLGASAFHLTFTTLDATVSKFALGVRKLSIRGQRLSGLQDMAIAIPPLVAPIENVIRGNKVFTEYMSPGSQGAEIAHIVDMLQQAGGRVKMDSYYKSGALDAFLKALRGGNYHGAILRAPFAAIEALAKPLMEYIVPRQKLGIFADMASSELKRLGDTASPDDLRKAMSAAWDSVDNRMGQLVYDNLFWHRTLKDLLMVSTRSLGWNLGTIREVGGGLIDIPKQTYRLASGKLDGDPFITHRMSYIVALPFIIGMYGAVYQYLNTGKGPEETKDYFYPKNADGERVAFASYMKDSYAYSHDPGETLKHKIHPLISTIFDMLQNEDYYGTKIRNEDDPIVQQAKDTALYLAKQFVPFSVTNAIKSKEKGESLEKQAQSFFGITPAPKSVTNTDAENLMTEYLRGNMPVGTRTTEDAERSKARQAIQADIRKWVAAGKPQDRIPILQREIRRAASKGIINKRGVDDALQPEDIIKFKRLHYEQAVKVYQAGTPDEKLQWKEVLQAKMVRQAKNHPDTKDDVIRTWKMLKFPIPTR